MADGESCGTCKFFRRHLQNINEGFCKRFPPIVVMAPIKQQIRPVSASANMADHDWCGEYKQKVTLQ